MKIAFVTLNNPFEKFSGGIESFVYHLSTTFAELGHEVWLVCLGDVKNDVSRMCNGVKVWILPSTSQNLFSKTFCFVKYSKKIINMLESVGIDVFYGQGGLAAPLFFSKPKRGLVFQTVHTLDGENIANIRDCLRTRNFKELLIEFAKFLFVKPWRFLYLKRTDRLIFVSKSVNVEFNTYYPLLKKKTFIIKNGCPKKNILHSNTERKYDFIFVGRLDKRKCPDLVINAVYELVKKGYSVNVPFIGIGPYKQKLIDLVNDKRLNDHISFFGYLDYDELLKYVSDSKFLILPSMYEGDPLVLKEALSLGTPCIVSNIPSSTEIICNGKNGFIYNGDSYSLSILMENVMKIEPSVFSKLSLCAKRSMCDSDWTTIAKNYLIAFNQK